MEDRSANFSKWSLQYESTGRVDYSQAPVMRLNPSELYSFESFETVASWFSFMDANWCIPIALCLCYLLGAFALERWMKSRPALSLKYPLVLWNMAIGIFSLVGFSRCVPDLYHAFMQPDGFYKSICDPGNQSERFWFWALLFALSKIPELADTFFIILRKKPLEAIQWYHHSVTMVSTWMSGPFLEPVSKYMVTLNYGVHGIMYPYFALRVAGIQVPRRIAKVITTSQFIQMVVCMWANLVSSYYYLSGTRYCYRHPVSMGLILVINFSFILMFGDLFIKLVIKAPKSKIADEGKANDKVKAN